MYLIGLQAYEKLVNVRTSLVVQWVRIRLPMQETQVQSLVWEDSTCLRATRASLIAQLVKSSPAMWETWVRFLGWEVPLEEGKATHSSILAWRIPWTVQSMGSQRVRQSEQPSLSLSGLLSSCTTTMSLKALEPLRCNKRSHRNEKPEHRNKEQPPSANRESPSKQQRPRNKSIK